MKPEPGEEGWLLRAAERGNDASSLDRRHADGAAWTRGNRVSPLIDGAAYFRRLLEELSDLREGDQVYFVSWRGDPAERLADPGTAVSVELARAISAGASVHGLIWRSHLDWLNRHARDNRNFVKMLQLLGGKVVLDQRVRAAGSHHQKFVVIRRPDRPESDVAFAGGIDLSHSRRDDRSHAGDPQPQAAMAAVYGEQPAWHGAHLEIHGPAVSDVEHCFRERWDDPTALQHLPWLWIYDKLRPHESVAGRLPRELPPPPSCGSHTVQLLRTYPSKTPAYPFTPRGERSVARGYAKALANARRFVYVEDQFLWSSEVAEVFAEALRREPGLHLVAVLPHHPDGDGHLQVAVSDFAHRKALDVLYAAGGDRVDVYELENDQNRPIYVHAKVCVVDDVWAAVGSANLNRRSWTNDSELTAAVVDEKRDERGAEGVPGRCARRFARELRVQLWAEHLGRDRRDDEGLLDIEQGIETLRSSAAALDSWSEAGRLGPRPAGRLRRHPLPAVSGSARPWIELAARTVFDPDGRPARSPPRRGEW